jgi:DNA-binding Lrp family transcriptional regulator
MQLDDIDYQLISLLRSNARMPVAKLAIALGVSRATATARLERLMGGVISGFTVVLESSLEAPGVRAITMIEVDGKHEAGVVKRLLGLPEVRQLHTTNGRWDLIVELEAQGVAALDELLRTIRNIDGIKTTDTSILLKARKSLQ